MLHMLFVQQQYTYRECFSQLPGLGLLGGGGGASTGLAYSCTVTVCTLTAIHCIVDQNQNQNSCIFSVIVLEAAIIHYIDIQLEMK